MDDSGPFRDLLAWYHAEQARTGIAYHDILTGQPAYWRAITEKIGEAEAAHRRGDEKGAQDGLGKVRKLYLKAVEKMRRDG